jgi:hypothetical protein
MKSKTIEWGIAALILIAALVYKGFTCEKPDNSQPEKTEDQQESPEEMRRKVMAEMGRKGGQKSKRGPAKKEEDQKNEV